jgi:hypothetical protein
MLSYYADPNIVFLKAGQYFRWTAGFYSINSNMPSHIYRLITNGAKNYLPDAYIGLSMLHQAMYYNMEFIIAMMFSLGIDNINSLNNAGKRCFSFIRLF